MKRVLVVSLFLLLTVGASALPVKGTVKNADNGAPIEGVLVTDGYAFFKTDARGAFAFEASDMARFISVVTPSGWITPPLAGFPKFYLPVDKKTKNYDFTLKAWPASADGYEMLAIADPQPKTDEHFARMQREVMPPLKAHIAAAAPGTVQAAVILGDIVWDSPALFPAVKEEFAKLGIPVYPVIGNHDHDLRKFTDREATQNYCDHFGPTYYAFDFRKTHYIVLDNILYYGAKRYLEQLDDTQVAWVRAYTEHLPAGERLCLCMHAPIWKSWRSSEGMTTAYRLIADHLSRYEVHFLTGHTHVNSNYDVAGTNAIEHNVAQICGNLWYDPMNYDGTPKGYLRVVEKDDRLTWSYRTLDDAEQGPMRVWNRGELKGRKDRVVVKIWEWDPHWTVVWYEDGVYRGSMIREHMADPDYEAWLDECRARGRKLAKPQKPNPSNFYFSAVPSADAREVRIVAADRFGRVSEQTLRLADVKE